jgi:hypothetical protein
VATATEDDIARLERRLKREGYGPLVVIIDTATSSLLKQFRRATDALRHTVYDQPLIALLISFEVDFAFARIGHRHALR